MCRALLLLSPPHLSPCALQSRLPRQGPAHRLSQDPPHRKRSRHQWPGSCSCPRPHVTRGQPLLLLRARDSATHVRWGRQVSVDEVVLENVPGGQGAHLTSEVAVPARGKVEAVNNLNPPCTGDPALEPLGRPEGPKDLPTSQQLRAHPDPPLGPPALAHSRCLIRSAEGGSKRWLDGRMPWRL